MLNSETGVENEDPINLKLGTSVEDGSPVELTLAERRQGTYIIGTTGTGKSTLLKNIVYQDMWHDRKHGLCLIDPHGDLIDDLVKLVPKDRIDDVILFNPMDVERPIGLNLLEREDPKDLLQKRWVVSTIMATLQRLSFNSWGPRLEHVLRHALLSVLELPDSTFIELYLILTSPKYRSEILPKIQDKFLLQFWESMKKASGSDYQDTIASTINKISPFITDLTMRNIIGQPKSAINLRRIMDEGKILFVNLSKGDLGETNSSLLGSVLVNMILIAALQRRSIPSKERKQFHLIVDEFQNFADESFAILQSEARKYAVDVTVAHQFRDQLDDLSKGSTLNVGNLVIFRVSGRDSYDLASQFDNTPPPPDVKVEPVYQDYPFQGMNFLIETKLSTEEGKLFQEVEQTRRQYRDVEAEMANRLSILTNYEAWCRLIKYDPEKKNRPRLVEQHFITDYLDECFYNEEIARQIQIKSSDMGTPRSEVEENIDNRTFNILKTGEATSQEFLTNQPKQTVQSQENEQSSSQQRNANYNRGSKGNRHRKAGKNNKQNTNKNQNPGKFPKQNLSKNQSSNTGRYRKQNSDLESKQEDEEGSD